MARFVMLRFEDNKEADAFVKSAQDKTVFHGVVAEPSRDDVANGFSESFKYVTTAAEAVALWADPTKLCACHPPWKLPNHKEPSAGLQCNAVRSANYGWLVCGQCSKPHPHQFQHPKNLLVPDETPQTRDYCLGFRADRSKNDAAPTQGN